MSDSTTARMIDEDGFRGKLSEPPLYSGDVVTDVLHVEGISGESFQFAQVNNASSFPENTFTPGALGLGPNRREGVPTDSFIDHLLGVGVISRPTFSLALTGNPDSSAIIFGGVDRARFTPPLHGLEMVDPQFYGVPLKSIAPFHPDAAKRDHARTFDDSSLTVLIDAGNPLLELPGHVVEQILDQYQGTYEDDILTVPRYQLKDKQGLAFHFDGVEIRIPLVHLAYPLGSRVGNSNQLALFRSANVITPPEWDAYSNEPKEEPYYPPEGTTYWEPEPTYPPKTTEHSHKWKDWTTATDTPDPRTTEHSHQWKDWKTVTWNVTVTNNQTWTVTAPCPTATAASTGAGWGHPQAQEFDTTPVPLRIKKSDVTTQVHRLGTPFLQHAYVVFDLWEDRVYIGRQADGGEVDGLPFPFQDEDEEKRLFSPPISRKNKKAWRRKNSAASLQASAISTMGIALLAVVMGSW
jgi:hypothetical protein